MRSSTRTCLAASLLIAALIGGCDERSEFSGQATASSEPPLASHLSIPARVDLPPIPLGVARSGTVEIENTSLERPVTVDRVASSCGCLVADTYAFSLEPGASRTVTFEVDPPPGLDGRGSGITFVCSDGSTIRTRVGNFALHPMVPDSWEESKGSVSFAIQRDYAAVLSELTCFVYPAPDPTPHEVETLEDGSLKVMIPLEGDSPRRIDLKLEIDDKGLSSTHVVSIARPAEGEHDASGEDNRSLN